MITALNLEGLKCVLFDEPLNVNTLLVGAKLATIADALAGCLWREKPEWLEGERFDLIVLDARLCSSKIEMRRWVGLCVNALAEAGVLLVAVKNAFNPGRLMTGVKTFSWKNSSVFCGYRGYVRLLSFSGVRNVRPILPLPKVDEPSELYFSFDGCLEVPDYFNGFYKLVRFLGGYHLVHDGYLFVCSDKPFEQSCFWGKLAKEIALRTRLENPSLGLLRIDLRERGALVLRVISREMRAEYIVRSVCDRNLDVIVGKNHQCLTEIHALSDLPDQIRDNIPRLIGNFWVGNAHVYIECCLPGIPAWKVNQRVFGKRILSESVAFMTDFNLLTKKLVQLDRWRLEILFADVEHLAVAEFIDPALIAKIREKVKEISCRLELQVMSLVRSHGDYGFGNILVNERTGELSGVIDWDTGRELEFPAIDLINLRIQQARGSAGRSFDEAIEYLLNSADNIVDEQYFTRLGIDQEKLNVLIYIAIIRYITRAAQYPHVFEREQKAYWNALCYVERVL